jgi:hypothetical protein
VQGDDGASDGDFVGDHDDVVACRDRDAAVLVGISLRDDDRARSQNDLTGGVEEVAEVGVELAQNSPPRAS